VAKIDSGAYAGLKYYTVLNSSLTERVDQIDRKTVNRQKTETCVVKNPKPSKSSKQGKPFAWLSSVKNLRKYYHLLCISK